MKKFLTFVLVLAMVMSVSSFAMAANGLPDAVDGKITLTSGTYTLTDNVILPESISIVVPAGADVVLNLNGKTISQTKACTASYQMISNNGTLTITGNGKLSFKDTGAGDPAFDWGSYTIRNEGNLVVENGTIEHLGEQNTPGNVVHMYCAIFQYSGSTTINDGTISTPTYRSVRLWKGDMTINGGNFEGQVWVQSVDNTSALTIKGGTFAPRGGDGSSVFVTNSTYNVGLDITDGTFTTKIGTSNATNLTGDRISGGIFTETALSNTNGDLFNPNTGIVENEDGTRTVVPATSNEDIKIYPDKLDFNSAEEGYAPISAKKITIENTRSDYAAIVTCKVPANYEVNSSSISVPAGSSGTFEVKPVEGLLKNNYEGEFEVEVTLVDTNSAPQTPDIDKFIGKVKFIVNAAPQSTTSPSSGSGYSGPDVWYIGGNTFGTNTNAVPTSVEIDQVPVSFTMNGSQITVGCIQPGSGWVTVRWGSVSNYKSFTPDANAYCAQAVIPKTGGMSIWAAIAQFLGF